MAASFYKTRRFATRWPVASGFFSSAGTGASGKIC
jgi:hypothetical protein